MKSLISALFILFSIGAQAEECMSEFNESLLFSEIQKGNKIDASFVYGYLIDGKYEPELRKKIIEKDSLLKILKFQYSTAQSRKADKVIKNESGAISVTYSGPDSGYNTEYIFKKIEGCWCLVEFINWST